MTLGHEFMGIVEEVGRGVGNLRVGDRVVVPFPVACGHCLFCNHELPGHCENSNPEHYGPEGGLMTEKGGGVVWLHRPVRRLRRRAGRIRAGAFCRLWTPQSARQPDR